MTFRDYLFWYCVIGWSIGALLVAIMLVHDQFDWTDPKSYLPLPVVISIMGVLWPVVTPLLFFQWLDEL